MSTTDTDTKDDGRLHSKRSQRNKEPLPRPLETGTQNERNRTAFADASYYNQMPGATESASSDRDQMTFRASERGNHPETHDAGRDTVTGFQALRRPRSGPLPEP